MNTFLKITTTFFLLLILAGCSSNAQRKPAKESVESTNTVVKPTKATNDHHEGEENVMPHDDEAMEDMMDEMMNDHHEGEKNVMPHGHEDEDTPKPPSRENSVEDHDDTGADPHGH